MGTVEKRRTRLSFSSCLLLTAVFVTACKAPGGAAQTASVTGEWTRSYELPADGHLQIINTAGNIEMEAVEGSTVDVRAERIARATTEQGARDLLTHITIHDETGPDGLTVETQRIPGVMIGASFTVRYHVKFPPAVFVKARTVDGNITVNGAARHASVTATNGSVTGKAIRGGFEGRATNGGIALEIAESGNDFVDLRVVNGRIELRLPLSMNANLSATSVNGRVDVTGLKFENFGEPSRDSRRLRGRINAGGTPIELNAVNGGIRVSGNE